MKPCAAFVSLLVAQLAYGLDGSGALRISDSQRYCQSARQCTVVYTRCDSCGCGAAINESFAAAHNEHLAALCASYDGAHCDKVCPIAKPACVLGLCVLQPNVAL